MTPKVIGGKYQVLEPLGKGAMCAVFRARDPALGRLVAIKVPLPILREHPRGLDRFAHEARTMAALHHPAIVQVFEVGDEGGLPFMAMELVDGSDLDEVLRRHTVGPVEGLRLLASVADALSYAASRGIVHRDLKPANVLVARDGAVKVADWGLAKALEGSAAGTMTKLTVTGRAVGTPLFMAPEQIHAQEVTPAADWYALGLLVYVTACETFPGGQRPANPVFIRHLAEELPPLASVCPGVPPALVALVEGLLAHSPQDRPDAGTAAHVLRGAAAGLAGEAPDEAPPEPAAVPPAHLQRTSSSGLRRSTGGATAPGQSLRRVVPSVVLVLVVVVVAFQLWRGGAGRGDGAADALAVIRFRAPIMRDPDQVVLPFEGEPRGRVRLTLGEDGPALEADLAGARPVSRTVHEVVVALPRPLVRRAALVLHSPEGGELGRFELDPAELVEAELRTVDRLGAGDLDGLLRRVGELRTRLVRRRGRAGYDEARALAGQRFGELLGEAGLSPEHQSRLGRLLPALLEDELPSGPLARRLMPLRLVEMAVSEGEGIRPAWGSVAAMLGFTFRGLARLQEVTPPSGFRRVGFCSLMSLVASSDGTGRRVPQYFWMVDPEGQRQLLEQQALAGMFSAGLAATVDEVIPRHDAWVTTATRGLIVSGPVTRPARLYLVLAGLIPGFVLEVILPGGETVSLLHVADLDPDFVPAPLWTRFLVSFPVEAAGVVEGRNDVGLRLAKRSMGEPPLGLAFREIGLWSTVGRGP